MERTTPKILCFAGSMRKDSFNKKLVKLAMNAAKEAGAQVTYLDLADYPLPVYNGDDEMASGIPAHAKSIKRLMKEHQAFLISSPEYNSAISGTFKNVIDWASRPEPGEKTLECFRGKTAGIMAASPGALGGLRGLVSLRSILENIGMIVIPDQFALVQADQAFDESGALKDAKKADQVNNIARRLTEVAERLAAPLASGSARS